MTTVLIALAGTAAAAALTWFFCLRPMLRKSGGTPDQGCCASPPQAIDGQILAAREELAQLRRARTGGGPDSVPAPRREA